jgi:hypothetical protein
VNRTKNLNQDLLHDLKKVLPDQISDQLFDRISIANDASHYLLTPTMVAKPKTAQQISEIFKISQKHDLGITFRSGGTSLSGQSVTDSLLIDTRKNFKEIEVLEKDNRKIWIVIELQSDQAAALTDLRKSKNERYEKMHFSQHHTQRA